MLDKSKLGNRFTCFKCGTKFYDLNRPAALCPECGADQVDAPVRDIKSVLSRNAATNRPAEPAKVEATEEASFDEGSDDDENFEDGDVDLGLGDLDDGDDDFEMVDVEGDES